jgi:RecA/RadA recombinase
MAKKEKAPVADESTQEKDTSAFADEIADHIGGANIQGLSSGFPFIDYVTDVHPTFLLPKGQCIELAGLKSTSKTTLAAEVIAYNQFIAPEFNAAYFDYEGTLIKAVPYLSRIGVDFSPERFKYRKPSCMEDGLWQIFELVQNKSGKIKIDLIVVDTIASMVPEKEQDGIKTAGFGESHSPYRAKIMSEFLRNLTTILPPNGPTILFINHQYEKVAFGTPGGVKIYDTPSSSALNYYCTNQYELKKVNTYKREVTNPFTGEASAIPVSNQIMIRTTKNKIGRPFLESKYWVTFGDGIDILHTMIEVGQNKKVLSHSGGKFKLLDDEKWIVGFDAFKARCLTDDEYFTRFGAAIGPHWEWQVKTDIAMRKRSKELQNKAEEIVATGELSEAPKYEGETDRPIKPVEPRAGQSTEV